VDRRGQILVAAQRVFGKSHYGAVSMEAVAAEAGVARGLLNHYFGTKHELYLAVIREMFRAGALPVPEYRQGATAADRLAESVDHWLDMVERNRDTWLTALGAGALGHDPEIEAILERVRESAVDNVIEVLGIGPAAEASPELRAVVKSYGGLAEAATREWLRLGRLTREQIRTLLMSSLLRLVDEVLPLVEAEGQHARAKVA
jgi:AcrR family transcriptional regulator